MNTAELMQRLRLAVFFRATNHPDYTDAVLLQELQDAQTRVFGRSIVNARAGYWLARDQVASGTFTFLNSAGTVLISPRAYSSKLAKVELSFQSSPSVFWTEVREVPITEVEGWALAQNQTGVPLRYVIENDIIRLLPWPSSSVTNARTTFYLRPPRLVAPQDGTTVESVTSTRRGQITTVATPGNFQQLTSLSININAFPFDQTLSSPAAPTGASVMVDIVRNGGWHEVVFRGVMSFAGGLTGISLLADINSDGTTVTTGSPTSPLEDFGKIRVGDWVRISGQSEWPVLPDDFHGCLADTAAIKVMTDLMMAQKASMKASSLGPDLDRFQDMITPRTQTSARDIIAPNVYNYGARSWTVKFP